MRFSCVGCGKCCNDHHVPLTLSEAVQWAADGGTLIVLTEGFLDNERLGLDPALQHARRRSLRVPCGSTHAYVAITFAAYNQGPCRNLDENLMCRIYERRPLVCRIYPMEINPHIPLRAERKDCPPQAWEQGPLLIHGGKAVDPALGELIERSRQADRDDIAAKAAICKLLGIRTMALKGEGFTAFMPNMQHFLQAAVRVGELDLAAAAEQQPWSLHAPSEALVAQLEETGALIAAALEQHNLTYIPLRQAS
ncbi:YkgJ family cysteine cluster protein [Pseudomonas sp. RIT-PI-S]|uniref:YkgJ family cysteine cluster protein n=1 Tax=Pseudomonas sp. RIT-PI-S TaxID=3035295 RepID=UPI0021D9CA41|nr:YkgJ family cysteine cluster protein [Pseudomonas sp. RIT-PI-S]